MKALTAGCAGCRIGAPGLPQCFANLCKMRFTVLVTVSLVLGKLVLPNPNPPQPPPLPKYLRCYRCLFETKELGCLLGSDICLMPEGSSCITLHIRNTSGSDIMVSDCRRREQMGDCAYTRPAPVFGFWIFSHCCFVNFCNDPQNRESYLQ
ncbi:lymphocyte antigen 6 complex locus protein G5c [Octodon degus]|uniref:Lymphocyte antigen 6 complex locus protein G5c n=1 Tax=Octodon degus TaxID=10160 RepID=A0A6P3ERJ3_OCTDE|nr:lymphocyte antigen 6 complex locus protein G5c [Octodon degus]